MTNLYTLQFTDMDKEKSIEENFVEALRQERNRNRECFKGIAIYWHLCEMLKYYTPNFLQVVERDYKDNANDWFYSFHKQFRQVDMFDGIGFFDRKISKADSEHRFDIMRQRLKYISITKPSDKDFDSEDEWIEKEAEFFNNDEFLKTTREKLRPYNTLYHSYEMKESFGGNMDMVMWLTISNDNDNSLYRFMDEFMAMYFDVIGWEEKKLFPDEKQ